MSFSVQDNIFSETTRNTAQVLPCTKYIRHDTRLEIQLTLTIYIYKHTSPTEAEAVSEFGLAAIPN